MSTKELVNQLIEIAQQKQQLVNQETEIKEQLLKVMQKQSMDKIDVSAASILYVLPAERIGIDTKRLRCDLPEIAERYKKQYPVKGFLKVILKDK